MQFAFGEITTGKLIEVFSVSDPNAPEGAAKSGAVPTPDSPQLAVVTGAAMPNLPGAMYRAYVVILAPGQANHNRRLVLDAETVATLPRITTHEDDHEG